MRRTLTITAVQRSRRRCVTWTLTALLASGATTLLCQTANAKVLGRSARVLRTTDDASLRYVEHRSSGSRLFEEGTASGTLPCEMHVYANIGPTFTASFTLFARGGTIVGHASAIPHGTGKYESFAGSLVATGGTGSYVHAHGRAGFYGVLNRLTYAMTVQTTGTLLY
jgi:hypothetical protein